MAGAMSGHKRGFPNGRLFARARFCGKCDFRSHVAVRRGI